jgi:hypothetical protein
MKDKLQKLIEAVALIKANLMPSLRMPSNRPPKLNTKNTLAAKNKKNPIDVAQQVKSPEAKNYAMRQAASQVRANNNQFSFGKSEGESHKYHIVVNGYRVTTDPVTIEHVNEKYGGVKALEATGHLLVPAKEQRLKQHPKTGQWSLKDV